jgi:hypothetical protein
MRAFSFVYPGVPGYTLYAAAVTPQRARIRLLRSGRSEVPSESSQLPMHGLH